MTIVLHVNNLLSSQDKHNSMVSFLDVATNIMNRVCNGLTVVHRHLDLYVQLVLHEQQGQERQIAEWRLQVGHNNTYTFYLD